MHGASAEYWGLPQTSFKSITHVRWGSVSLQDSAYTVGNLSICETCEVLSATFVLQNGNSTVSTFTWPLTGQKKKPCKLRIRLLWRDSMANDCRGNGKTRCYYVTVFTCARRQVQVSEFVLRKRMALVVWPEVCNCVLEIGGHCSKR